MWRTEPFISLGLSLSEKMRGGDPELSAAVRRAVEANPWFTEEGVRSALEAIVDKMLAPAAISEWLARYATPAAPGKKVGVVMAGNIPLVGFFDMMCVVAAGHECLVKPSSKDAVMMEYVIGLLKQTDASIPIETLSGDSVLDMAIATGSDNSSRYFKQRFIGIPCLLRGHRYSVAILSGDESDEELGLLARDVFTYFGMGCRSVGKIFIPEGFPPELLAAALGRKKIAHGGYLAAYRQNRAMLRMRGEEFVDGGFFTLRKSSGLPQALPDIVFDTYRRIEDMHRWLSDNDNALQCVVAERVGHPRAVAFGAAQRPRLWDYADGADTMTFLGCRKK